MTIGDNFTYPVKGIGTCSIHLSTRVTLHLKDVLFVPGIKRNLISIFGLADQGYRFFFQESKVLYWIKNSNIKNVISIGVKEGSLYKICNSTNLALNHVT